MRFRDYSIVILLVLGIIFTSWGLYFVIDNRGISVNNKKVDSEVLAEDIILQDFIKEEIEVVLEEEVFPSIDICYKEYCYNISSESVESFYTDSELEVSRLNMYILEYVIPYFEDVSGGKDLVQNSKGSFYAWKEDFIIDTSDIYEDIESLLLQRSEGYLNLTHLLSKKDMPGTDGKYAGRYIEIDNSKQKLYDWEDGKVVKEIELSAAKYGWQVYGVFPVVDKGIEPRAPSGNYMPYWMAFYYSPSQKSWYGLHGLVWWYDENGNRVYENTDYIGERRSAGCIRMLLDDAKYLYGRYEKGDHILIHE